MDQHHTPAWTHLVTSMPSRRDVLRGLAGAGLGFAALHLPGAVAAKKKRKRKNKKLKLKRNEFGCVNVGDACQGNSANCCSGICEGNKPKQDKKDTSRCVDHNASICKVDIDICTTGELRLCNATNTSCGCLLTTGNAGFCADLSNGFPCRDCRQDRDCEEEFGPGAACLVMAGICESLCPDTATACAPPCA